MMTIEDEGIRAYLLGRAAEADAERLEVRLLEDDEVFLTVRGIEDDLFDDYARGSLASEERQRFLDRYGGEHDRILVARALAGRSAGWRRPWMLGAVAAALVASIGVGMWLRHQPPPAAVATGRDAVQSTAANAIFAIRLGTSRSRTEVPAIAIPANAPALELRVRLDPADRFDAYSMELRSQSGALAWSAENLHASIDRGDLVVVGVVPASALGTGSYELSVRGSAGAARQEALGFTTLSIER